MELEIVMKCKETREISYLMQEKMKTCNKLRLQLMITTRKEKNLQRTNVF